MEYKAVFEMDQYGIRYGMFGDYCGPEPVGKATGSIIIDPDNTDISIVKPFSKSTDEDICKYIASHINGDIDLTDIFKLYDKRVNVGGSTVSTLEKFEYSDIEKECTLEYTMTHNNSNHYRDTVKIHVSPAMGIEDLSTSGIGASKMTEAVCDVYEQGKPPVSVHPFPDGEPPKPVPTSKSV